MGELVNLMTLTILQTPARYYPYIGGVENYLKAIIDHLRSNESISFEVICAKEEPRNSPRKKHPHHCRKLTYFIKVANTNITPTLPCILLKSKFDILHTHIPTPWSADWSALIAFIKRKPLVVTYHNDICGKGPASVLAYLYNKTLLKLVLHIADAIIITQSKYLETNSLIRKHKNKTHIIPIGIPGNPAAPLAKTPSRSFNIGFISLLDAYHKYKNLECLLEAIKHISGKIPSVVLHICGRGELLSHYKALAHKLGIEQNIVFHGFVPQEKMEEFFNNLDLFVLPSNDSTKEGFGIVLLEALAYNLPIVTTPIVGVAKDVRKHNLGEICDPITPENLAFCIQKIHDNPNQYRPQLPEHYTIEHECRLLLGLYENLLKSKPL